MTAALAEVSPVVAHSETVVQITTAMLEHGDHSPFIDQIGVHLAAALAERGVSQAELARQTGIPRSLINGIIRGRRNTTLARIEHLFNTLGYDLRVVAEGR